MRALTAHEIDHVSGAKSVTVVKDNTVSFDIYVSTNKQVAVQLNKGDDAKNIIVQINKPTL